MTEQIPRVLLIDLENCPSQIYQLMEDLEQYSEVVVCYAQSGAKIPIDWLMPLTKTINDRRLKLLKMPVVGKNAADFGITFWAGSLMTQLPEHTHFDIISNDTDLDYAVALLQTQGRSAERIGIKAVITDAIKKPIVFSDNRQEKIKDFFIFLNTYKNNRAASKSSLLNTIKAKLQIEDEAERVAFFNTLIAKGVISLEGVKIIYYQEKIDKYAK